MRLGRLDRFLDVEFLLLKTSVSFSKPLDVLGWRRTGKVDCCTPLAFDRCPRFVPWTDHRVVGSTLDSFPIVCCFFLSLLLC